MAGGTTASVINVNKRNQAISAVVNNLNYSIDSMVRDIKTGYLYKCDYTNDTPTIGDLKLANEPTVNDVCGNHLTLISTISGIDTVVRYELIEPISGTNGYIQKTVYAANGSPNVYNITDKINVNIDSLKLTVNNPDALDVTLSSNKGQPSVAVIIKGQAGGQNIDSSNFYIQTFISQRLLNLSDFIDTN
jgi:hypothetical protein